MSQPAATVLRYAQLTPVFGTGSGMVQTQTQIEPETAFGRAELLQQRWLVDSNHQRELQACQQRFAITACFDEARRAPPHGRRAAASGAAAR